MVIKLMLYYFTSHESGEEYIISDLQGVKSSTFKEWGVLLRGVTLTLF